MVWARLSADGRHFTQFERLGDQDELTAASLLKVNHNGEQALYAVGWRSVYQSEMAAAVGEVDYPFDLEYFVDNFNVNWSNRLGMRLDTNLSDPAPVFDGRLAEGMLLRARLARTRAYRTPRARRRATSWRTRTFTLRRADPSSTWRRATGYGWWKR